LKRRICAGSLIPLQLLLHSSQTGSFAVLLQIVRGRLAALVAASAVSTAACAIPEQTTRLGPDPDPVTVSLRPDLPRTGQPAEVTV
jgi:hypothetical protein